MFNTTICFVIKPISETSLTKCFKFKNEFKSLILSFRGRTTMSLNEMSTFSVVNLVFGLKTHHRGTYPYKNNSNRMLENLTNQFSVNIGRYYALEHFVSS